MLAGLMTAGKEQDKAQTHLVLELTSAAVRVDGSCKAVLAEKPEILKCISSLLAFEQVSLLPQTLPHSRCALRPAPFYCTFIPQRLCMVMRSVKCLCIEAAWQNFVVAD